MKSLRNAIASITTKLFLALVAIATIALFAGVGGMIPLRQLEKSVRSIGNTSIPALFDIIDVQRAQIQIMLSERTLLIRDPAAGDVRRNAYASVKAAFEDAARAMQAFDKIPMDAEQQAIWRDFRANWSAWSSKQEELWAILREMETFSPEKIHDDQQFENLTGQAIDLAFGELNEYRRNASETLNKLEGIIQQNAIDAIDVSLHAVQASIRRQIILVSVAFIGSLLLSFWLSRRITSPILRGVSRITEVADGNLRHDMEADLLRLQGETGLLARAIQKLIETQRRETSLFKSMAGGNYTSTFDVRSQQDELGLAVRQMVDVTNETLGQVNIAVTQVTYGASAINNASQTLSEGATETAASLEEISVSINQIGEKIKTNAASAVEADKLAASSRTSVGKGYDAVAEMIAAMRDLQKMSAQIAAVVKLIDDIAFQTNLLALNAAVEAARAGRHGKGFSVVADEVRNLAGRSAKAAKDTAQMLEVTVQKLENGATLAENTDSVLREIVANAAQVSDLFREIARSSSEQSQGIEQIAIGLSQIDRVTQHNTLSASEAASAAIALLRQAESLRSMMERFRLRAGSGERGLSLFEEPPRDNNDSESTDFPSTGARRGLPHSEH